jgi:hypothetical protein
MALEGALPDAECNLMGKKKKPSKPTQQQIVDTVLHRLNEKQLREISDRKLLDESYHHKPTIIPKSEFDSNLGSKITATKLANIL